MQVEQVDFVSIPTRDRSRAVAWYRDVFGLPESAYTEAELETPKRTSRLARKPEPIPTASAPAAPTTEIDDAKAHEAALEMFIRLTESDRQHAGAAEVDQGAVRAALARTAARKKPGGHRLQPHEGQQGESPGGPPRREAQ